MTGIDTQLLMRPEYGLVSAHFTDEPCLRHQREHTLHINLTTIKNDIYNTSRTATFSVNIIHQ